MWRSRRTAGSALQWPKPSRFLNALGRQCIYESIGVHHGSFRSNRSPSGNMAYLHRLTGCLALLLLCWLPASSFASYVVPATKSWGAQGWGAPTLFVSTDVLATCAAAAAQRAAAGTSPVLSGGVTVTNQAELQASCVQGGVTFGVIYAWYGCASGGTYNSGNKTCTMPSPVCVSPQVLNSDGSACVSPPGPCTAGTAVTSTAQSGWLPKGDLVGAYTFQNQQNSATGCVLRSGQGCSVTWGAPNAAPMQMNGSFGHSYYTIYQNGTTTGATCAYVAPDGQGPEPTCAGQLGIFNGATICLPPESQQSINDRAAAVAAAAAAAARQAALNAGRTQDQADLAARAAGAAAAAATRSGSTPGEAAAAGAAAGSAAASSAAAGASSSSTMNEGTAAGTVAAAGERARTIATAAGASAATIAQAEASARAAAATTAASVLRNGGTLAQANEAARLAGQTATASVLAGSTGAEAQERGVNAGIGNAAGSANGTTSGTNGATGGTGSEDPVGDFCAKNPQAKMCKIEEDSSFSGACGSPPACAGDAVMCAVAAATFATNCTLTDPHIATPLYDAAVTKSGDQTGNLPGNSTFAISAASFNQTELLGAAAGMPDKSITIAGKQITIPFGTVNLWLSRLGVLLQAVTFILCIRIVTRG